MVRKERQAGVAGNAIANLNLIREVDNNAPWRLQPATKEDLVLHVLEKRGRELVSPLLSLPAVNQFTFVVDWLHTSDLGVAADFAGNCMCLLGQKHFAGNTYEERLKHMWVDLKQWYKVTKYENQYNAMTEGFEFRQS